MIEVFVSTFPKDERQHHTIASIVMRVPTTPDQRRRHVSAASPTSFVASPTNPIMSPSQTPPKWMKNLAERNRLSMVEPLLVEPEDKLAELMEEYSPLFETKTSIEFTPQDDNTAQYMYRDSLKLKANEKKTQFPAKRGEGKSGYDFDSLMGNDF
jgi:hypothetical protein